MPCAPDHALARALVVSGLLLAADGVGDAGQRQEEGKKGQQQLQLAPNDPTGGKGALCSRW